MAFPKKIAYLPKADFQIYDLYLIVLEAMQCVVYYNVLEASDKFEGSFSAWYHTTKNAYQQNIIISWTSLFLKSEENFYKKTLIPYWGGIKTRENAEQDPILEDILLSAGMDHEAFNILTETLKTYRNKFLAHKDIAHYSDPKKNLCHPRIDPLRKLIWGLYLVIRKLLATYDSEMPLTSTASKECWYVNYDSLEAFEKQISEYIPSCLLKECSDQSFLRSGLDNVSLQETSLVDSNAWLIS